jgi:hypothetical protein
MAMPLPASSRKGWFVEEVRAQANECAERAIGAVAALKLHESFQRGIERVFFGGKSTKSSVYLTYAVGNVILMLLLFYIFLNRIAYDWTG